MTDTQPDPGKTPGEAIADAGAAIASREANAELEHTRGGTTTRSDATDVGVPMLAGSATEPVGPEDALGKGPKRGDYSGRMALENPHTATEEIPEAERLEEAERRVKAASKADRDGGFNVSVALGDVPRFRTVDQSARAGDVGEVPGKGGVSTDAALGRKQ